MEAFREEDGQRSVVKMKKAGPKLGRRSEQEEIRVANEVERMVANLTFNIVGQEKVLTIQ